MQVYEDSTVGGYNRGCGYGISEFVHLSSVFPHSAFSH